MRILHVASFVGNIGDNASHKGLYSILKDYFDNFEMKTIEIRKFYKNYTQKDKQKFDIDFITYANKFDLLIIGGGGFLDYWVEGSSTGTTIDMPPEIVKHIEVPTIIASVGCIPHKDIPKGNIQKFRSFLTAVEHNPKVRIMIRNDGSVLSISEHIGAEYLDQITEILDNGFFYSLNPNKNFNLPTDREYVAINITNDQLRMKSSCRGKIDIEKYQFFLLKTINYICKDKNLKIIFVPHIYSDLKAISEIISRLDDFIIREYISVAPCLQGNTGADFVFSIYQHSLITLGSRFHANICSLAMNKPTIGLISLDRVKYVYDQLNLSDSYVLLDYDFSMDLINIIEQKLSNLESIKKSLVNKVSLQKKISKRRFFDTLDLLEIKM